MTNMCQGIMADSDCSKAFDKLLALFILPLQNCSGSYIVAAVSIFILKEIQEPLLLLK